MVPDPFRLDSESRLFLHLLRGAPPPDGPAVRHLDWRRFLLRASGGRVLYAVARTLRDEAPALVPPPVKPTLARIVDEGDHRRLQLQRTLEHIRRRLDGRFPYLVAKTARPYPYITFDVDLLVLPEDYNAVARCLTEGGGRMQAYAPKKQHDLLVPGLLRIDLHHDFCWQGSHFVDAEFVWSESTTTIIEDIPSPTPNATVEWALVALNLLYERTYLPWLDYLALQAWEQRGSPRAVSTEENNGAPLPALAQAGGPSPQAGIEGGVHHAMISSQARLHGWIEGLSLLRSLLHAVTAACALAWPSDAASTPSPRRVPSPAGGDRSILAAQPGYACLPLIFSASMIARLYAEGWRRRRSLPCHDLAYAAFAKARYHLTRGQRFPIYGHWFDLGEVPCR
ncbi:MAG: nucleotidyltransferase family protein [Candidatus Tectomicrobia bacterium]|nr:nucleotidyltransferase family protein [Candidatus Tectomicrobia bacterium]